MSGTNGTQPSTQPRAVTSPGWFKPTWYKPLGQLFELLSVIAITSVLGVLWLPQTKQWLSGLSVGLGISLFVVAVVMTARANDVAKSKQQNDERKIHLISDARLRVLRQAKVPSDVTRFLRTLINEACGTREINAGDLVARLKSGLGPARAAEVKDLVLKYTENDVEKKPDAQQSTEAVASVESNGEVQPEGMKIVAVST